MKKKPVRSCAKRGGVPHFGETELAPWQLKQKKFMEMEPWRLTQKEFLEWNIVRGLGKRVSIEDIPPKSKQALIQHHQQYVLDALTKGNPVPDKVLAEYPHLQLEFQKPKMKIHRPLPKGAENPQDVRFNSDDFTCYGNPTKRGYRVYCRRK